MTNPIRGKAWTFGDHLSTDHIISVKYLGTTDPQVFADHAMEVVDPEFSKKAKPGDLVVAGKSFGSGSSREQAALAFKTLGIAAILAESFARIFFRNCINIGLPAVECPGIAEAVADGDVLEVDLEEGIVIAPQGRFAISGYPPRVLEIVRAGGLIPLLRQEFEAGGEPSEA